MRSDVLAHVFSEVGQQQAEDSVRQSVHLVGLNTSNSTAVNATDTRSSPKPSIDTSLPSTRFPCIARAVLVSGLVLSLVFLIFALRSPSNVSVSLKSYRAIQTSGYTKPIEEIQLGERVVGKNPDRNEVDASHTDPDPETWRTIKLTMLKCNGGHIYIELLRPISWIKNHKARMGNTIFVNLPEIGQAADADVEFIGPCAAIEPGPGNVCTGRFIHKSDGNLLRVRFVGQSEALGVTSNHPFWSEGRNAFVVAGQLIVGEKVNSVFGTTTVQSISPPQPDESIYNLEVHRQHVYRVGKLGILVHNTCPAPGSLRVRNGRLYQLRASTTGTGLPIRWHREGYSPTHTLRVRNGRVYDGTRVVGYTQPTYSTRTATHMRTNGHAFNSKTIPGKSRFFRGEGGQRFANDVIAQARRGGIHGSVTYQGNGRIAYRANDVGRNTGRGQTGSTVRGGTVVVQQSFGNANWRPGEIVTQFPS